MLTILERDSLRTQLIGKLDASLDRILSGKRSSNLDDRLLAELAIGARIGSHATGRFQVHRVADRDDRTGMVTKRQLVDDSGDVDEAFGPVERMLHLHDAIRSGTLTEAEALNLVTNVGRVQMHLQVYGASGLATNGFVYIGNSADAVSGHETATSTTLSAEITTNGLARAAGTPTLASGTGNVSTNLKVFTATGAQAALKSAEFTASSSGVMCHVIENPTGSKSLGNGDTLTVTMTHTLA